MLKAKLQGHKTVHIDGQKFVIRKINPIMDFLPENMPQIFTSLNPRRDISKAIDPKVLLSQMMNIVGAALVYPDLVAIGKGDKKGKEDGITIDDIFRDQEVGSKLFFEVMIHSLNRFSGLKSLFFSLKIRLAYWIASLNAMGVDRRI